MNNVIYKIINCVMPWKNYVNHRALTLYNEIDANFEDPMTPDNWQIPTKSNWGSARPDNLSIQEESLVKIEDKKIILQTDSFPDGIRGKDYDGNISEVRYYRSASTTSKYKIGIGQSLSVLCSVDQFIGCAPAIWLFPVFRDEEEKVFYRYHYREIDLLESYRLEQILQSIHFGSSEKRKFNSSTNDKHGVYVGQTLFTLDLHKNKFVFKVNGEITGVYFPCKQIWKPMNLILSESVTNKRSDYKSDMYKQIPLGKMTVSGIKISNL